MTVSVRLLCDQANPYGTCAAASIPARTVEQALAVAEAHGWALHRDRHYCPACRPRR